MNIYMFHYVNDITFNYYHFDYKELENVIVNFINKKIKIISFTQFKNMVLNNDKSIGNCVLLTFDDGTLDHFNVVYPILKKYDISGLFFLCSNILHNEILDVNLIHQLIANSDFDDLYNLFECLLKKYNADNNSQNRVINTEFDNQKMLYFKQMLQFILPDDIKNKILIDLAKHFNISLNYNDYYLTIDQIKEMKSNGMEFGFHTVHHKRLSELNYTEQKKEIITSYTELLNSKLIDNDAPFSYPFGSYNEDTIKILKEHDIKYAFSINSKKFDLKCNLLNIPRYDCNILKRGEKYE